MAETPTRGPGREPVIVNTGIDNSYPLASVLTGMANRLLPEVDERPALLDMDAARWSGNRTAEDRAIAPVDTWKVVQP
jgi:hypothetical protein